MTALSDDRYRFPAEWESHAATWLAWPENRRDWPGKIAPARWALCEFVRLLTGPGGEQVNLIVQSAAIESNARRDLGRAGADLERVTFFRIPTDRNWCRDAGPIFLKRGTGIPPKSASNGAQRSAGSAAETGSEQRSAPAAAPRRDEVVVADFAFNAWAKYNNFSRDDRIAGKAARLIGADLVTPRAAGNRYVLEGGAIDVNGAGTLLTTAECLLDHDSQPRNAHLSQSDMEAVLRDWLGVEHIIYLPTGIVGDDTGGHIDDLARFVNPHTIVVCEQRDPTDPNYGPTREAAEVLATARLQDGSKPTVVALAMPRPLYFDGVRLPASYANFYIANQAVLVPTFNDPADRTALDLLAELMPTRQIIGIHAVDLVWGFGTLHCLSQQQPATS
jgi:agmatine deiminase